MEDRLTLLFAGECRARFRKRYHADWISKMVPSDVKMQAVMTKLINTIVFLQPLSSFCESSVVWLHHLKLILKRFWSRVEGKTLSVHNSVVA